MNEEAEFQPKNFYEMYKSYISPKLEEIDLLIKTGGRVFSIPETARVLELSEDEIIRIMEEEDISVINRLTFFSVMMRGSSKICRFYNREVECGSPLVYTKKEIAYIYGLNFDDVVTACRKTGISEATAFTLPRLFAQIPL